MTNTQILVLLVILTVVCLGAAVHFRYTRKKRQYSAHKAQTAPTRPEMVRAVQERMLLPKKQLPSVQAPPTMPNAYSARREALRQNLRIKVTYDEAKIDRLIEIESSELKRKGEPDATVEDLMERAIERWDGRIASEQKNSVAPSAPTETDLG